MKSVQDKPTFKTKLFFWIILGSISTFFAEVIAGSFRYPFLPFIDLWGIIITIPLYTMHILLLAHIIYYYGKPKLHTLFIAGAIFGMYEAYMTGILWTGWNGDTVISLFGLGIIESIILVLFWHPIISFIIPILFAEILLTKTDENLVNLKKYATKKYLILLAILLGLFQSLNVPSPIISIQMWLANIPIIAALLYFWNKNHPKQYSMKKLLPNKKQFKIILVFLLLQYAFLGFLNAKNIPNLASQSFVWLIYIILFILLNKSLKKSKEEISNGRKTQLNLSWKNLTLLSLVFLTSSVIFSIIFAPFKSALWILLLFIYITIGLKLTIYSIKKILSK